MSESDRQRAAGLLRQARALPEAEASEAASWARCAAPASRAALLMEIRRALALGDTHHADALIVQGLLFHRNHPSLLLLYAERLLARGRMDEASAAVETARALRPDHFATRWIAAEIALSRGDAPAAVTHLNHAIRARPDLAATARESLVEALLADVRVEEATTALAAIEPAPPLLRARLLLAQGRPRDAVKVLETALGGLDSNQERDDVLTELIDALERLGDRCRLPILLNATTITTPRALARAGRAWLALGKYERAASVAEALLDDPRYRAEALTILAAARCTRGAMIDARAAVIELGTGSAPTAANTAEVWRAAISGEAMLRILHDKGAGTAVPSPLRLLLEDAAKTFSQAAALDAGGATHLSVCRTALGR